MLRYVNCGHNPPLLCARAEALQRLSPTAPALGLLDRWEGTEAEVRLEAGDLLLLYSDGATEAMDLAGEEFGDARLQAALEANQGRPLEAVRRGLLAAIEAFAGKERGDDLTLVLVRVDQEERARLSVSPAAPLPAQTERHSSWSS